MESVFLIALSILPALGLLLYFEHHDRGQKEPLRLKWKIFWWGVVATIFAAFIEMNLDSVFTLVQNKWIYIILTSFVTAALVEESLKLWVVKRHIFRDKHFDEVMDGITYTVIASLGFATLENIIYVFEFGYKIGVVRALLSVPAHALFSGVMGYYIGRAKFEYNRAVSGNSILKGLSIAIIYHGLFDFFLFTESAAAFLVLPLMVVMAVHLKQKINLAHFNDKIILKKPEGFSVKRVIKIIVFTLLIFTGTTSVIGSIILVSDNTSGYGAKELVFSTIFAAMIFGAAYYLNKSKGKK